MSDGTIGSSGIEKKVTKILAKDFLSKIRSGIYDQTSVKDNKIWSPLCVADVLKNWGVATTNNNVRITFESNPKD
jgi:hypothetical protein